MPILIEDIEVVRKTSPAGRWEELRISTISTNGRQIRCLTSANKSEKSEVEALLDLLDDFLRQFSSNLIQKEYLKGEIVRAFRKLREGNCENDFLGIYVLFNPGEQL